MNIDTHEIKLKVNILDLIPPNISLKRVASTKGGEYAGPCPFCCEGRDRFHVQPHNETGFWFCRHCSPTWQDSIAYVMKRDNLGFMDACKVLGGDVLPIASLPHEKPKKALDIGRDAPSKEWQADAWKVINGGASNLQKGRDWLDNHGIEPAANLPPNAPNSAAVYRCLLERGLTPYTIERAKIGYNPKYRKSPNGYGIPMGILIPNIIGGVVWAVRIRRGKVVNKEFETEKKSGKKYMVMGGSVTNALYGADSMIGKRYGVIVEGEFDALLLSQFAGDLVGVGTLGASSNTPNRWKLVIGLLDGLFVALDNDKAGKAGLLNWKGATAVTNTLPNGCDITDYHKEGGNLRKWVIDLLKSTDNYQRLKQLEGDILSLDPLAEAWQLASKRYGRLAVGFESVL